MALIGMTLQMKLIPSERLWAECCRCGFHGRYDFFCIVGGGYYCYECWWRRGRVEVAAKRDETLLVVVAEKG